MDEISDSYPDAVPFKLCVERQWQVVGNPRNPITRLFLRSMVYESARQLKNEIDESRRADRVALNMLKM